jgi:malate dehydrogenase (oxaloacetate-decarboxylating)(NADP+)
MALANPNPEILPEDVKAVRDDAIMATGRSDYPEPGEQRAVLPLHLPGCPRRRGDDHHRGDEAGRGQGDRRAGARRAVRQSWPQAYGEKVANFGPEYLIPKPFDPRLIVKIAPAVAEAAMESGVATRPIKDFEAYRDSLDEFVYHSGLIMKPVFSQAKQAPRRIVFAEGEDERVLRAMQVIVDEGIAKPILIGHPGDIARKLEAREPARSPGDRLRSFVRTTTSFFDEHFETLLAGIPTLMERKGVSVEFARREVRRRASLFGALMVRMGDADGLICGTFGRHDVHASMSRMLLVWRRG